MAISLGRAPPRGYPWPRTLREIKWCRAVAVPTEVSSAGEPEEDAGDGAALAEELVPPVYPAEEQEALVLLEVVSSSSSTCANGQEEGRDKGGKACGVNTHHLRDRQEQPTSRPGRLRNPEYRLRQRL